jgi:hypothetical protein
MILKLDECGLINSTGMVSRNIDVDGTQRLIIDFNDYVLFGNSEQKVEVSFSHFPLTEAGRELSTIVTEKIELNTIKEVCEIVAKRNKSVEFTLHKVACRNQSGFDYEDEILDKWKGNDVGVS